MWLSSTKFVNQSCLQVALLQITQPLFKSYKHYTMSGQLRRVYPPQPMLLLLIMSI